MNTNERFGAILVDGIIAGVAGMLLLRYGFLVAILGMLAVLLLCWGRPKLKSDEATSTGRHIDDMATGMTILTTYWAIGIWGALAIMCVVLYWPMKTGIQVLHKFILGFVKMRPLTVSYLAYYFICMGIGAIGAAVSGYWLGFFSPSHFTAISGLVILVYIIARYCLVIDER